MSLKKLLGLVAVLVAVVAAGAFSYWHRHQERFSAQTDLNIKNFVTKGPSWYPTGHRVEKVKADSQN